MAQARRLGHLEPVIAVPSGNFGNLYAGLLAQRTGLGVKAFVVATNVNRTVPDYLDTGEYRTRPSLATLSSAMDVGTPSNWERIQALFQGDLQALRASLRWGSRSDAQTEVTMAALRAGGYEPDPHGAVACGVLEEHLQAGEVGIFMATAHPAKFLEIQPGAPGLPEALAAVMHKPVLSKPLANDLEALKAQL